MTLLSFAPAIKTLREREKRGGVYRMRSDKVNVGGVLCRLAPIDIATSERSQHLHRARVSSSETIYSPIYGNNGDDARMVRD